MFSIMGNNIRTAGLVSLYYLLIHADGKVSDKELKMGEVMCKHEDIDNHEFRSILEETSKSGKNDIYLKCIDALRQGDQEFKIKCIAWMSLIANADGFMAPDEWKLIYKIYAKELQLNLEEILNYQKKLPRN